MPSLGLRRPLKDKISSPSNFQSTSSTYHSSSSNSLNPLPGFVNNVSPFSAPPPSSSPPLASSPPSGYPASSRNSTSTTRSGGGRDPYPPKRVVRALRPYRARAPQELSFDAGDFFHLVGEVSGRQAVIGPDGQTVEDWFDASNPLTGARGLVPAGHFELLGRNAKESSSINAHRGNKSSSSSISSTFQPGPDPRAVGKMSSPPTFPPMPHSGGGSQPPGAVLPSLGSPPQTVPPLPEVGGSNKGPGSSTSPPPQFYSPSRQPPPNPAVKATRPQPLYGIVQYDFVAERADELNAKRGEPIIVIAQSNHEWFVAKPIGRLGGPGLIPVAFVEIQDVHTGKAVDNVDELIRSQVVPRVEEWKKTTMEYKSSSIPLGKFDFGGAPQPSGPGMSPGLFQVSPSGEQQGRRSQNGPPSIQTQFGNNDHRGQQGPKSAFPTMSHGSKVDSDIYGGLTPPISTQGGGTYSTAHGSYSQPSLIANGPNGGQQEPSPVAPGFPMGSEYGGNADREKSLPPIGADDAGYPEDDGQGKEPRTLQLGIPNFASVESFHQEEGSFWFHVRAKFESGAHLLLYRLYEDFYDFQIALMDRFPAEAGRTVDDQTGQRSQRVLPMMPGPTDYVDEEVCAERADDLTEYLSELCRLPEYILLDEVVTEFWDIKPGDVVIEKGLSSKKQQQQQQPDYYSEEKDVGSGEGDIVEYLERMGMGGANGNDTGHDTDRQSGQSAPQPFDYARSSTSSQRDPHFSSGGTHSNTSTAMSPASSVQGLPKSQLDRGSPSLADPSFKSITPSPITSPAPSSLPLSSNNSGASQLPPFIKLKILHRDTDDLIAIRVPPTIGQASLLEKVRERLGNDVSRLMFREGEGMGGGGGQFIQLSNNADLANWVRSGSKMVLHAD